MAITCAPPQRVVWCRETLNEAPKMELGLEPTVTRLAATGLVAEFAGELTEAHLLVLVPTVPRGNVVQRLSDRHHALARSIASGIKVSEAAILCGYRPDRAYLLRSDPAFNELVSMYRAQVNMEFASLHSRLASVAGSALNQLQDRLEEEELPVSQLVDIVQMGADRAGAGPTSTNVQLNIHANLADRMRAARERAMRASGTMIEATPNAK